MLTIYGTEWCGDCTRAKFLLDSLDIKYDYIDIDLDEEASEYVVKVNNGYRSVPVIVFADGSTLTEPSNDELILKLGL